MALALPVWIIIVLVLLGVLIILFKTMNQVYLLSLIKKNFFYFFAIALFIFLAISLTHIHSNHEMDLTSSDGIKGALKIYYGWAANIFSNIGKVTSYVIQQDWINASAKELK